MQLSGGIGFAVANDENEHKALTLAGYGPEYGKPEPASAEEEAAETTKRGPGRQRKES
jgi:hypothetical protein